MRGMRRVRGVRGVRRCAGSRAERPVLSEYEPPSWLKCHPQVRPFASGYRLHALANLPRTQILVSKRQYGNVDQA